MLQHRFHDAVGTLPVLDYLFEIALEQRREVIDLRTNSVSEWLGSKHLSQFVDKFGRERGEIVDEVQWVLDLMSNTGGQLAE